MDLKKAGKVLTVIVAVVTLLAVIYIMINRIGLQDELDFGAGAYYYADIPEFEPRVGERSSKQFLSHSLQPDIKKRD